MSSFYPINLFTIFTFIVAFALTGPQLEGRLALGRAVVTMLTGAAAAETISSSAESKAVYDEKKSLSDALKSQGIKSGKAAIYSVYFEVDPNTSGRWIFDPNVFLAVQIEGEGTFIVPRIEQGYKGQPLMENLISNYAKPGSRVLVHVLDDRHWTNRVWNSILQNSVDYKLTGDTKGVTGVLLWKTTITAEGEFRILDRDITIRPPKYMASAEFLVPETEEEDFRWVADARIIDTNGYTVGKLQFAQVWVGNSAAPSPGKWIFWGILGMVAMGLCIKFLSVNSLLLFSESLRCSGDGANQIMDRVG